MTLINKPFFVLDEQYATTRRVTNQKTVINNKPDDKIQTQLFLPANDTRKGKGGLRTQGYFKTSSEEQPLITVITVVLNGEKYLEQSILSVIEQSYDNVEYIIIDGGSTDSSLEIIRRYENKIDYWISEKDNGIYDAFNTGIQLATGDWICFLGSDDYFCEQHGLSLIEPYLIAKGDSFPKLVHGNIAIVNKKKECLYMNGEPWEIAKTKINYIMPIPHPGLLHHKTWFLKYGLFDNTYHIAGDYEMLLRGRNEHVMFIPQITVAMRQGGISSHPNNAIKSLYEMKTARQKHIGNAFEWHFFIALLRVYIRLILQTLLGKRITYYVLDIGRFILGKKAHWTKL